MSLFRCLFPVMESCGPAFSVANYRTYYNMIRTHSLVSVHLCYPRFIFLYRLLDSCSNLCSTTSMASLCSCSCLQVWVQIRVDITYQ